MGKYIQQPDEGMPNGGVQRILHFIKTFPFQVSAEDLDLMANAWLLALTTLDATPIIKSIQYSTLIKADTPDKDDPMYSCQIHYVLVE